MYLHYPKCFQVFSQEKCAILFKVNVHYSNSHDPWWSHACSAVSRPVLPLSPLWEGSVFWLQLSISSNSTIQAGWYGVSLFLFWVSSTNSYQLTEINSNKVFEMKLTQYTVHLINSERQAYALWMFHSMLPSRGISQCHTLFIIS